MCLCVGRVRRFFLMSRDIQSFTRFVIIDFTHYIDGVDYLDSTNCFEWRQPVVCTRWTFDLVSGSSFKTAIRNVHKSAQAGLTMYFHSRNASNRNGETNIWCHFSFRCFRRCRTKHWLDKKLVGLSNSIQLNRVRQTLIYLCYYSIIRFRFF